MYLCLKIDDRRAPHRQGRTRGREIVHIFETIIFWKGSTGRCVKITVNNLTNPLRRVFPTYRLHDRLPTYAKRSMTNEVT